MATLTTTFFYANRCNLIKYAPAHMDLHVENILLSDSRIKFIDWNMPPILIQRFVDDVLCNKSTMNHSKICFRLLLFVLPLLNPKSGCLFCEGVESVFFQEPFIFYMMLMWYEVRWQQTKDGSF